MKRSEYYSICFFLTVIWQCVTTSQTVKDWLVVLAILYIIDTIVSLMKGN